MDIVDSIMTAGAAASEAAAYLQAHQAIATEPISVDVGSELIHA
jgi:orotate phosphoribosyltransferase